MRRRVQVGAARETPPEVLRAVRAVHPAAEVVYMGQGRWWLGVVTTNAPFLQETERRLARERLGASAHGWMASLCDELARQGFSFFGEYPEELATAEHLAAELTLKLSLSDLDLDRLFAEVEDQMDGGAARRHRMAAIRDTMRYKSRDAFARYIRHRVQVSVDGLNLHRRNVA